MINLLPLLTISVSNIFTVGLTIKTEGHHKWKVKQISSDMEPSVPFFEQVKFVDAESITKEKIRTPDLPLGINKVTSKLESHFCFKLMIPILKFCLQKKMVRIWEINTSLEKSCTYYHYTTILLRWFPNTTRRQRQNSYSRSKQPVKSVNHNRSISKSNSSVWKTFFLSCKLKFVQNFWFSKSIKLDKLIFNISIHSS